LTYGGAVAVTASPSPSRSRADLDASTPERILDAAEALVAERGIDAVSLRAVNQAAAANVAAAHYHFGSKDAVVEAVLQRRMQVLSERRAELVAALAADPAPSPRAVVAALVAPLAEFADHDPAGLVYVRFLAALSRSDSSRPSVARAFAPQYSPFLEQLERALPSVPRDLLEFRLALAGRSIIECLAELGADHAHADALIDYVTGALAAPVHGGTR
jgi:AcrR family transcriptional regulator